MLLDSVPGAGATFTVVVPPAPHPARREPHPDRRGRATHRRFRGEGLSANGFAVTVVGDAPSVYDCPMTGGFDLMVLDIGLPGMDGFAVLRELRTGRYPMPVIVRR